jgi:CRP-like cAMP-binding protein
LAAEAALLATVPFFALLDEEERATLAAQVEVVQHPKGHVLFTVGDPGDSLYIIRTGTVEVFVRNDTGHRIVLETAGPRDFFGEMSLLDDAPRSATVRALSDAKILALSRSDFLNVMRRSPDVAMAVVQELTRRLRDTDEQASSLSFQRVTQRTQGLLQRMAKDDCGREGRRITPILTHQQIADMIGTSRETVTRALKGLKQLGWLDQEGKRYVVPVEE